MKKSLKYCSLILLVVTSLKANPENSAYTSPYKQTDTKDTDANTEKAETEKSAPENPVPKKSNFSGEFTLKPVGNHTELGLAEEYRITINGGSATVEHLNNGEIEKNEGNVSLTMRRGIDPLTRTFPKLTGFIRIEIVKPGWNDDKFVTRFDLRFTAPPVDSDTRPVITFAEKTVIDVLWLDELSDGLTRYTDPMNVQTKSPYAISVVKSPF